MPPTMSDAVAEKLTRVRTMLVEMERAVVGFSGGVDSTLLVALARQELGPRVLAVTAVSAAFPPWERAEVQDLASRLDVAHRFVETREVEDPAYAANPPDRCYHCRQIVLRSLLREAGAGASAVLLIGTNLDDLEAADRPGNRAAREQGVRIPLAEARLRKEEVRAAARAFGLPTWDKPALACLSSRFPFGVRITAERLGKVAAAEAALRDEGFRSVRVRYHGDLARIEVAEAEASRFGDPDLRRRVAVAVRGVGFEYAAVDLEGYRPGRLHAAHVTTTAGSLNPLAR